MESLGNDDIILLNASKCVVGNDDVKAEMPEGGMGILMSQ